MYVSRKWEIAKQSPVNAVNMECSQNEIGLIHICLAESQSLTVKMEIGKFVNGSGISKCERLRAMGESIMSLWCLVIWSQANL